MLELAPASRNSLRVPIDDRFPDERRASPAQFVTTRWSRVLLAGEPEADAAQEALESLCRDYWRPLFDFARRKGHSPEDAQDLTQGFIAQLLAANSFSKADRERGRFRTFLLSAFSNYMTVQYRGRTAQKRGGQHAFVSLEENATQHGDRIGGSEWMTPEREYERSWALALLERVMQRLQGEYDRASRQSLFAAIQPHLTGGAGRPGYAGLGASLGMSESAITVAVHRMRKRYGQLLREEIAETVASPQEVEDELRHLIVVVSALPGV